MSNNEISLLCLAGSLRVPSYSLAACKSIREIAIATAFSVEVMDPRELDLPMYDPGLEPEGYGPRQSNVERLLTAYRKAEAMIWVSPTYHGTVSGAFKNMLDFAELLSQDKPPYLQGRPVGLISINDSTTFSAMRDSARELRAWLAPTHIELKASDFSEDLIVSKEQSRSRIKRLVEELAGFVRAHQSLNA